MFLCRLRFLGRAGARAHEIGYGPIRPCSLIVALPQPNGSLMALTDFTFADVYRRNATLFPQRTAFVVQDQRVTHLDYLGRVQRLAAGLAREGITPGDRVAVLSQNSLEMVELIGAVALARRDPAAGEFPAQRRGDRLRARRRRAVAGDRRPRLSGTGGGADAVAAVGAALFRHR